LTRILRLAQTTKRHVTFNENTSNDYFPMPGHSTENNDSKTKDAKMDKMQKTHDKEIMDKTIYKR